MPQKLPASSTTGRLVTRCSRILRRARSTNSFTPPPADDDGRMTSATLTPDACPSSASGPQPSRSLTTPTTVRVAKHSNTGAQPKPDVRMARAASAVVSSGVQQEELSTGSITSLQQLILTPIRC